MFGPAELLLVLVQGGFRFAKSLQDLPHKNFQMQIETAALWKAVWAAAAMLVSHGLCVCLLLYFDLSGKWDAFALQKNRSTGADRVRDYWLGWKSFCADLLLIFIPCMTLCFAYRHEEIESSKDTAFASFTKLVNGYVLGKLWAFGVHYALHFPSLYKYHRRHHRNPKNLVASAAWDDSLVEYAIMEIPAFSITVMFFPTHFLVHLLHFAWHGWDGACGHSGFAAPGWLGFLFDGEYHYYHHSRLTVNYAELEFLDKLFGTHHSQGKHAIKKSPSLLKQLE